MHTGSSSTPENPSPKSADKRVLGIVFFTVFLDLLGFGIIIPIQPFYAEALGASPMMVTWLGASFSLMQFLFSPFWGRLSDRIGRRPVILTSTLITVAGYTLFGLSQTLPMLFFARMLSGLGSANIGTAHAIIADCTTPETRAKGMGIVGAAFGLGFIIGPALGGLFVPLGLSAPAYVAAALCLINFNFAYLLLPETHRPEATEKQSPILFKPKAWVERFREIRRHPFLLRVLVIFFLFTVGFSLMEQVIGLFIETVWVSPQASSLGHEHAIQSARLTAFVLLVVGIVATIIQGGLIGKLAKAFGEKKLLIAGLLLVASTFVLVPAVGTTKVFWLLLLLFGLTACGTGIYNPSIASLLSQAALENERGGVMGLGQSLSALGRVIGPAMAGILFQIRIGLPFYCGAALILFCALLGLTLSVKEKKA